MGEITPIGLPNLVSQSDLLARARSAQSGADAAGRDAIAHELQRLTDLRAEQVQRTARIGPGERRQRERERGHRHGDDPDARYDNAEDGDDEVHALDVSA
jgi:hypothetical protein